jgi:hypothetical protein
MTLDEYGIQLLERIRNCSSPTKARDLIAEGHLFLAQSHLSERTLRTFWSSLRASLEFLSEDLIDVGESRAVRSAVLTAAHVAITQHQNELAVPPDEAASKP